jgi:hypothetical protein
MEGNAMRRINLGRISAAVAAISLAGGVANRDAIAAMVAAPDPSAYELKPGEIKLNLDLIGAFSVLRFQTEPGSTESIQYRACSYSAPTQQRLCSARVQGDSSSVIALTLRDRSGAPQLAFDSITTDTVIVRQGRYVDGARGTTGDSASRTYRSTRRYTGVSAASDYRVLDGADSSFASYSYPGRGRYVRNTRTVTYSNVTLPNTPRGEVAYPTNGVVHATGVSQVSGVESETRHWLNVITHFDGTRTPEAYIGGQRYTLDLATGVATPKPIR